MTVAARRHLAVVPAPREEASSALGRAAAEASDASDTHLTVPVARTSPAASAAPWRTEGEVAWVPAALLLAAAGRCSCDDCCAVLARQQARKHLGAVV